MNTKDVILSRRSIRSYLDTPISDEDLMEILEAGLYAPSAENFQPWYFVVLKSEESRKRLDIIMGEVADKTEPSVRARFEKYPDIVEDTMKFIRQLGGAPVYVLAFMLKEDYGKLQMPAHDSVCAAIQNMLLMAEDKGIGSCWLTAPLTAGLGDHLHEMFAPDKGSFVGMVTLGYPKIKAKAPRRKDGRYEIL